MIEFNLNEYIHFKPNDLTHTIYRDFYTYLPSHLERPVLAVDEKGYAKLQGHEFMRVFGEHMSMLKQMPFADIVVRMTKYTLLNEHES